MVESFDFVDRISFKLPDDRCESTGLDRRRAFRAIPPGVRVRMAGVQAEGGSPVEEWRVNDISSGGMSIAMSGSNLYMGETLRLDVLIAGKIYLHNVAVVVVRNLTDEVACSFSGLTRNQETKVDKLVLEMQKRFIIQQKKAQEEEELMAAAAQADDGPISIRLNT